jgi:hypothetical protein
MSSKAQEQLLSFFQEAAGTDAATLPAPHEAAESSDGPSEKDVSGAALATTDNSTSVPGYASTSVGTSSAGGAESQQSTGGTGSTIESAVTTFFEGGLGIVPLVSGLIGLFGGGKAAPPKLEKYQKASSIDFVSADTPNGLAAADYDQLGMPRLAETALPTSVAGSNSPTTSSGAGGSSMAGNGSNSGQSEATPPQMTLNIQAMDAQSIMDRSGDIAQAVRSAMLNMNSINDVIGDM